MFFSSFNFHVFPFRKKNYKKKFTVQRSDLGTFLKTSLGTFTSGPSGRADRPWAALSAPGLTSSQNYGLSSHCQPELLYLFSLPARITVSCLSASQNYGLLAQCQPELLSLVSLPARITVSCLTSSQNYGLLSHCQPEVSVPARITVSLQWKFIQ